MGDGFGAIAKFDLAAEADFRLGDLLVRPSTGRVIDARGETRVEPRVMEVLIVLRRAQGATVTREQLVESCWGGRAVSDDAITRVIAKVRQLANGGDDPPHFILETLPKVGYRLTDTPQRSSAVAIDGIARMATASAAARHLPFAQPRATNIDAGATPNILAKRLLLFAAMALALIFVVPVVLWKTTQRPVVSNAEAVRLTQAARTLIHERNRASVAEAEHLLRQAVAADPSYAPAWARLGHATWFPWWPTEQNDPGSKPRVKAEALGYIRRALTISPNLAEAQGIMGMVLTDTNEGLPWLERAVQLDPESAELWMWLGDGRRNLGDLKGALAAYEKARAFDPAWHYPDEPYLDIVFRLRGPAEAYRVLDRIASTMNDRNWVVQERADMEYGEGRLADSAALAAESLHAHPQNPYWARSTLLRVAALVGDTGLQDRILDEDPLLRSNFNALHRPGWAYTRAQTSPDTWWDADLVGAQAAQLVSENRSALLVDLYDHRFKTPDDFISKCPSFCNPIAAGPALVLAFREVGRTADADRMLSGLTKAVRQLEMEGDQLFNTQVSAARLAALAGETNEANRRLRDAVGRSWKGQDTGFPDPESDPVFASMRNSAEFRVTLTMLRSAQKAEAARLAHLDLGSAL